MEMLILCVCIMLIIGVTAVMTAERRKGPQISGSADSNPAPSGTDTERDNEPLGLNVGNR